MQTRHVRRLLLINASIGAAGRDLDIFPPRSNNVNCQSDQLAEWISITHPDFSESSTGGALFRNLSDNDPRETNDETVTRARP